MSAQELSSTVVEPAVAERSRVWKRLAASWRARISAAYILLVLILSVGAPLIAPYSPIEQDLANVLSPPDGIHILGTDDIGRDVFSRLIYAAPVSLSASLLAVIIAVAIGVPFGLLLGYAGGIVDEIGSRIIDTLMSFPGIVLAIGVTGVLGIGVINAMIAVGIIFSPILARLTRAQTMVVRKAAYVTAAEGFGVSPLRIVVRHILPNAVQPLIVQIAFLMAMALLAEASLSFLGLGVQPPFPSWGGMLAKAYGYMEIAPEQTYPAGLAILFTSLAFSQLGEALRRALDVTLIER